LDDVGLTKDAKPIPADDSVLFDNDAPVNVAKPTPVPDSVDAAND
jgi:hypothetical protein